MRKPSSKRRPLKCAYCKGPHESSDHSPAKCLLIWPPSADMKVLTIPSCIRCNQATSRYENLVWILLALVGRHPVLEDYRSPGGKLDRAFLRDPSLRTSIEACKNSEGNFEMRGEVAVAFDQILRKTTQGLYYGLYGRVPPLAKFQLLSIEDQAYRTPEDVVFRLRKPAVRDLTNSPLPSLSRRGLPNIYVVERVVTDTETGESYTVGQNVFWDVKQEPAEWIDYQKGTIRFCFFQNGAGDAICVLDLWNTLVTSIRGPWPNQRGELRKGRKNENARDQVTRGTARKN